MFKRALASELGWFGAVIASMAFASSCSSIQDELQSRIGASTPAGPEAFVEAFIEYAGPAERWGGAEPVMVQFSARDEGQAFSLVSEPTWRKAPAIEAGHGRAPASVENHDKPLASAPAHQDAPASATLIEGEGSHRKVWEPLALRERLAILAEAVQESAKPYAGGCLYPVRVRLLRGNGGVVEKSGCRSSRGWVKMASALVADAF